MWKMVVKHKAEGVLKGQICNLLHIWSPYLAVASNEMGEKKEYVECESYE